MMIGSGKIHYDIKQNTPEWDDIRRGKVSASKIKDVMAGGKGLTRNKYMVALALERVTGISCGNGFQSYAMQQGNEREPIAREQYAFIRGVDVVQAGFVEHPFIPMAGSSPDGLMHDLDRGLEIKCPEPHTHLEYLRMDCEPSEYTKQIQFNMACAGMKEWDFVSYNPDFPPQSQLVIRTIKRDEKLIDEMETAIIKFQKEVADLVLELADMKGF